ncbi:DUF4254 domain-containing protein, partial [Nocardia abscessus]|uniref:DUF4254 domain-containing protein n=1 Tax=Nocardia abscessus TaxID=120957 RepID=UPI0024589543
MDTSVAVIREIERRRVELVMAIDDWVMRSVPQHRLGATLHTETVGAVIDRLAESSVRAHPPEKKHAAPGQVLKKEGEEKAQ